MFRIIYFIVRLLLIAILGFIGFATISDYFSYSDFISEGLEYINKYPDIILIIGIIALTYIILMILSNIEKLYKNSSIVKSKTKEGEVEVTLKTLAEISNSFLLEKGLIKSSKTYVNKSFSNIYIEAKVEAYSTDGLNEKIEKLQQELKEYIELMVGIKFKKCTIRLAKINPKRYIETENIINTVEEMPKQEEENIIINPEL